MDVKFTKKYKTVEKMLKHWSYRALNLEGRISIVKVLALPNMTHLAVVLPELDEQMATTTEQLILKFIWKNIDDHSKQGQNSVNKHGAKIEQAKGGLGLIETKDLWNELKASWIRRLLQLDYNEPEKTQQTTEINNLEINITTPQKIG